MDAFADAGYTVFGIDYFRDVRALLEAEVYHRVADRTTGSHLEATNE